MASLVSSTSTSVDVEALYNQWKRRNELSQTGEIYRRESMLVEHWALEAWGRSASAPE